MWPVAARVKTQLRQWCSIAEDETSALSSFNSLSQIWKKDMIRRTIYVSFGETTPLRGFSTTFIGVWCAMYFQQTSSEQCSGRMYMSISVILSCSFILLGVDCAAHPPSSKTLLYSAQNLRAMRLLLAAILLGILVLFLVFAFQSPVMNPPKPAVSVPASAATTTSHCFSWWTCKAPILGETCSNIQGLSLDGTQ